MATADFHPEIPYDKACSTCRKQLPLGEFYRDSKKPDGLYARCKKCHGTSTKKYAQANSELYAASSRRYRAANPEKCMEQSRASQKLAYDADTEKFRARSRANYARSPEKAKASSKAHRIENPEKVARYMANYYDTNKVAVKASVKERAERLREELKPGNCERVMRRNAQKLRASPAWANLSAMQEIYTRAAELTKETGIPHHVDHAVPLQSKKVCGLHVEHNLQILTAKENQEKSNKWWPDAP